MADVKIPESHVHLFKGKLVVTLVTVMPDGQPQATPVWADYDGEYIIVNTARGRQKDRNMSRDAKVTVMVVDQNEPYRWWVEVRGYVADESEADGLEMINHMAKKYVGVDEYYGGFTPIERKGKETRVTYRIKPTKINTSGG
jgi:PPOX class probable F420-dependent enzyme